MSSQPQLLPISLHPQDVVYTPSWVARDMVEFFNPVGSILEPCAGDGVFLKFLNNSSWCEIAKGKDFFAWNTPVDWIVGNPPFKQFDKFLLHSYRVAQNIVYLIPADKPFSSLPRARMISDNGDIVHMRYYVDGPQMDMPEVHRPMAAFYFRRGYRGAMEKSYYSAQLSNTASTRQGVGSALSSNNLGVTPCG